MRIDQIILNETNYSKKTIKRLMQTSQIAVNGQVVKDLAYSLEGRLHKLTVGSEELKVPYHHYYQLYKPRGIVTAKTDAKDETIFSLLPLNENLFSVGRLDKNTTGLILALDNGPLGYYLTQDHFEVIKCYQVVVNRVLTQELVELFAMGIIFADGKQAKPAKLTIIDEYHANIIISEGKRHQVKKMFLAVGYYVEELHRQAIGPINLDDNLAIGMYRPLTNKEIASLYTLYDEERNYNA